MTTTKQTHFGEILMKAIVYAKYGAPDVLQLREVAKPTPGDNEVSINHQSVTYHLVVQGAAPGR
jgi:hypothetical protein